MKFINRHVINKYAVYWEQIGENLDIPHLDTIKHNHHSHPTPNKECLKDVLKKWLDIDVHATWKKLQEAINQAINDEYGISETGTYVVID